MALVAFYSSNLATRIVLTVWVARTLYRSGRIFLPDASMAMAALPIL